MFNHRFSRIVIFFLLVGFGVWLVTRPVAPSPETAARSEAVRALGPVGVNNPAPAAPADKLGFDYAVAVPVSVNLLDVPQGGRAIDPVLEKYRKGEIDLNEIDGPLSETEFLAQLRDSLRQGVVGNVQVYAPDAAIDGVLTPGASFKSIDYTQSQQGVPPDPEMMVGTNHIVVSVNTSFQVFDKNGNSLYGPVLFDTFWGNNCGTGSANMVLFDPFSTYDESANRYVLGITGYDSAQNGGDNGYACIAVSQTDSATGSWNLYSFDGNPGAGTDYFFDYPHIGTGQNALYLSANMFGNNFVRNHVMAFDKNAMYAGLAANSVKVDVGSAYFTLQPVDLKGYTTGGWPTNPSEPHYYLAATYGSNQNQLQVFRFNDPWGTPSVTLAGTVTVNTYSLPVSQPQLGSSGLLTANDDRMLDAEYWGGRIWGNHTIGCNPGSGTVNCIRWYEINISSGTPSLVQQGTFSTVGEYRSFPDLAVNACGDMLVGYTKTSSSIYPGVYVAGREVADAAGTLKSETTLHAGEDYYTAYDSSPRRWGDYTGMTIDPDGKTFWYLGEYSRNQPTARWSTWVGSFTWSACSPNPGPTPTPGPSPTPTNTPVPPTPTPIPDGLFCSTAPVAIPDPGTATSVINVADGRAITDLNVSLNASHTWVGDLTFTLSHNGVSVAVIDRPGVPTSTYGCSGDDINATLDDEAALPVETQCAAGAPTINGVFTPNVSLTGFDGQVVNGSWTMTVNDAVGADAGTLNQWCLVTTLGGVPPTPTNTPLPPTPTNTPLPPTPTNTSLPPTPTNTPLPPPTNTPLPPTPTDTPVPPTPTDTPVPPTPTDTPVPPTPTNTPIPPTPTPTPVPGSGVVYITSTTNGNAGGVPFEDEDILAYSLGTGLWSMYFDGSDVGLDLVDVDALEVLPDGTLLLSLDAAANVTGLGTVADADIIRFIPTSLGGTTAGTFEWYFDGSDVELSASSEDIDAFSLTADGKLVISTVGSPKVTGLGGLADEDLILFTPTSLGANTAGTWSYFFDGSDVALGGSSEDVNGAWIASANQVYLSTLGNFSVTGLSGDGSDIFVCTASSLGSTTACTFAMFWDGSARGFAGEIVDGFDVTP